LAYPRLLLPEATSEDEAHVFYPFVALGVLALATFLPTAKLRHFSRYAVLFVFFFLALTVNFPSAQGVLKGMQNSIGRVTPMQYDAADWIRQNLPLDADIYDYGTVGFQNYAAKIKWLNVLSQRNFITGAEEHNLTDHVMIDYSDALLLRDQNYVNAIEQIEAPFLNSTLLYNKNNIRIYRIIP